MFKILGEAAPRPTPRFLKPCERALVTERRTVKNAFWPFAISSQGHDSYEALKSPS